MTPGPGGDVETIDATGLNTAVLAGDGPIAFYERPGGPRTLGTTGRTVSILPLVNLSPGQNAAEGGTVRIEAYLNGPAPAYPVTVPFTVGGSADSEDHDLSDGVIIITAEDRLSAGIDVQIVDDGINEGIENLLVILQSAATPPAKTGTGTGTPVQLSNAVLGNQTTHSVVIEEGNLPPDVRLFAQQAGRAPTRLITRDGGRVLVIAVVDDPNPGDSFRASYDWSRSDNALVANALGSGPSSDSESFAIDPTNLNAGHYTLRLTVNDGQVSSPERSLVLSVPGAADLAELGNELGDIDDDGIPNGLDDADRPINVLPTERGEHDRYLIESQPGTHLSLGRGAVQFGDYRAQFPRAALDDLEPPILQDSDQFKPSGVVNFVVRNLPLKGATVNVVLGYPAASGSRVEYRTYNGRGWDTLSVGLASLQTLVNGLDGKACPPPQSLEFINGADWDTTESGCLQLWLRDGGPHDADGEVNGEIEHYGYVGVDAGDAGSNLFEGLLTPITDDGDSDDNSLSCSFHQARGNLPAALLVLLALLAHFVPAWLRRQT